MEKRIKYIFIIFLLLILETGIFAHAGFFDWFNFQKQNIKLGAGVMQVVQGGTSTSTAPTYGQMLVGNSGGTYTLTATSSLGINVSGGTAGMLTSWLTGTSLTATSAPTASYYTATSTTATSTFAGGMSVAGTAGLTVLQNGNVGIGSTTPGSLLSVGGNGTGINFLDGTNSTSTISGSLHIKTNLQVDGGYFALVNLVSSGNATINGNLSVAGSTYLTGLGQGWLHTAGGNNALTSSTSPTVNYIVATSTTATSTFAGGLDLTSSTGMGLNFGSNTLFYQNNQRFLTSTAGANGNLTIGYQSATGLDSNGGLYNTGVGYQALGNATSTDYNTALGYQALKGGGTISNTGYNTAIGYRALYLNTTGNYNTANGLQSLYSNTTGFYNTANGYQSLYSNTTGSRNTADGLGSLFSNTTGSRNTANGYISLYTNTTGSYNTAIGYGAGYGTTVDQRSVIDDYATFIGYQASRDDSVASTTALSNITAIGKNARVGASNTIVLGGTGADAVNVGIGTTTPWRKLSVTGTVGFDGLTGATGAGSLCLDANKQVVYNSASDACLSSTRATKHDIQTLNLDGLSLINSLQPSSFIYNQGDGRTRYGFIAEDTALVDDRLATHNEKGEITGIDDRAILSVVVKAVKDVGIKLQKLVARISGLEQRVNQQEKRIDELEKIIQNIYGH